MSNTEHRFADPNRHVVEVPHRFAIARWPRDTDVPTIARCILGTLKYEPHSADTTALPRALEREIEHKCHSGDTVGAHALVRAMVPPCCSRGACQTQVDLFATAIIWGEKLR